jgi:hypothetical protein
MGFLKKLFGGGTAAVQQLPTGTITVDRNGEIVTSTVASTFSKKLLKGIAADVLELIKETREAETPLAEVSLHFGSLRVTARELRGGAIIFLLPQTGLFATHYASKS